MKKDAQAMVRMTDDLKSRLISAAHANDRTLTSEINERLAGSFDSDDGLIEAINRVNSEVQTISSFFMSVAEHLEELSALGKSSAVSLEEARKENSEVRREVSDLRREIAEIRRQLLAR